MNKRLILSEAKQLLSGRQKELLAMLEDLNRGLADDTKSSAGDKYETSRAMSQQEIDKISVQLKEVSRQLALIPQLESSPDQTRVQTGALVDTSNGTFFIGLPAGQLTAAGKTVFCLGSTAPIAQKLLGLTAGQSCELNGRKYDILYVS